MNVSKKIPKKNDKLAWRTIEDETVIMLLTNQLEDGEIVNTLNKTATRIWELIDGKNSEEDLILKIIKEYDIEAKKAKAEVKKFLNILYKKQLIA
jgi:hypothetical protein